MCLSPIIRGVLWGVDTRILKIRCFLAEIEAKQNHVGDVFAASPFTRNAKGHHAIRPRDYQYTEKGHFFSNRVVKDYNSLPNSVKEATAINAFKNSLDKYRGTPSISDSRPTASADTTRRGKMGSL